MTNRRSFLRKVLLSTAICSIPVAVVSHGIALTTVDKSPNSIEQILLRCNDELNNIPKFFKFEMIDIQNYCEYISTEINCTYGTNIKITPSHMFNTVWGQWFSSTCSFEVTGTSDNRKYAVSKDNIYRKTMKTNTFVQIA